MGGEVLDDPSTPREEEAPALRLGGGVPPEAIREFEELQTVLLLATPPAHKGLGLEGSVVLAELVRTHRPRVVVTSGKELRDERLGTSLLVGPGLLPDGRYAVFDVQTLEVERHAVSGQPTSTGR